MDAFRKPHIGAIYHTTEARVLHPYDRKLFRQYPVFPLFVLDSGAFLLANDKFGAADGDTLFAAVADGSLFADWTRKGSLEWDLAYKQTSRSSMRNAIEMQSWINRLYFLLPLAQRYLVTGDEKWAKLWFRYFAEWEDAHPFRKPKCGNFYEESDLVWFDMQVCWRSLVLMHSTYLLADSKFMTRPRWKRFYKAIEFHARCLLTEGVKALESNRGAGNHFLQKGAALLYAGICFPEFGMADDCIAAGKAIIKKMMENEIYADGGSIEASPSYSHFIARQYVDAYTLMKKNGVPGIEGLEECIQKQYDWMDSMASPSRRTLQFNDSYALDVDKDLEIVASVFPLKRRKRRKKSFVFPVSHAARIANRTFAAYVDAMPQRDCWHDHHGRPNFVLYCEDQPLLVDSGCPNYDRFLRETYITRSRAHNVLDIHEKPEYNIGESYKQPYPRVTVDAFRNGGSRAEAVFTHRFPWEEHDLDYTWTRTILLAKRAATIADHIESSREITATQRFHFAPVNLMLSDEKRSATIFFNGSDIRFEQTEATTAGPFDLAFKPAFDQWNRMSYAPCLSCTGTGTVMDFQARVVLPSS